MRTTSGADSVPDVPLAAAAPAVSPVEAASPAASRAAAAVARIQRLILDLLPMPESLIPHPTQFRPGWLPPGPTAIFATAAFGFKRPERGHPSREAFPETDARSAALGPVLLKAGNGFRLGELTDFVFGEADASEQEMDEVRGQCL